MKKCIALFICLIISVASYADEKANKLKKLMEIQGLIEMFQEQIEMGKAQHEKVGKQVMEQFLSQLNPNEEFQNRFSSAYTNYMGKVVAPWGAEEIVEAWGQYYGKHFTKEELGDLITFYSSPLGKKELQASRSALTDFTLHFQKLGEPIFKQATQEYIDELKIVASDCKCRK